MTPNEPVLETVLKSSRPRLSMGKYFPKSIYFMAYFSDMGQRSNNKNESFPLRRIVFGFHKTLWYNR